MKRKFKGNPTKKCTIEELCTSFMGSKCDRWCTDKQFISYICEMIDLGLIGLGDIKELLIYSEWCKFRKIYNAQKR